AGILKPYLPGLFAGAAAAPLRRNGACGSSATPGITIILLSALLPRVDGKSSRSAQPTGASWNGGYGDGFPTRWFTAIVQGRSARAGGTRRWMRDGERASVGMEQMYTPFRRRVLADVTPCGDHARVSPSECPVRRRVGGLQGAA